MSKTKWIKPGISVVNITNLTFVYTVDKVIFQSKTVKTDEGLKKISRIRGVQCKYYDEHGELHSVIHHSKELVPYNIALKGVLQACMFVNREGEYKDY
jgi:hypothetical protein